MREPRPISGGRASLFDRLIAPSATAAQVATQDYAALAAAVTIELTRLFNTRCRARAGPGVPETVVDYGIPELTQFCPENETDRARLAALLEEKIRAFEPRLCDVRVELAPCEDSPFALWGCVSATLRAGQVYEPVSFALAVDREGARLEGLQKAVAEGTR